MREQAAGDSLSSSDSTSENPLDGPHPMIFAAFAEDNGQLYHTLVLSESIREFAGKYRSCPIWIYMPEKLPDTDPEMVAKLSSLKVEIKTSEAPVEALKFFYSKKVFAAAEAEAEAEDKTEILAWMDEDTILLKEPRDFVLAEGINLGYRPVMHQNIGSRYSEPPDEFWSRVYQKLSIPTAAIFPMITPADLKTLRPYFNAGLLVVRPERGTLRRWAESFPVLYQDPIFVSWSEEDIRKKIFLHQVALVGAILTSVRREEMVELSELYNYPIFFKEMFGAEKDFHSIDQVVTLRYDVYFRDPEPDWSEKLTGSRDTIQWLEERLAKE